jgi:hypothetical protein
MEDELLEILKKVEYTAIRADRHYLDRKPKENNESNSLLLAVRDVTRIFYDGQQRPTIVVQKIAERYGVNYRAVCQVCELVETGGGFLRLPSFIKQPGEHRTSD